MGEQGGSFVDGMFGGPGGWLDQTTATPTPYGAAKIKVNHDNVLAAAKIIQAQIDSLSDVMRNRVDDLSIVPAGNDRVSIEAANAWNDRLLGADDSYSKRVVMYVESLQKLVVQLRDSAKQYGFSEEDIAASFGSLREV
jgi:hypothetical protein